MIAQEARPMVRLSLRELRELPYRAMRVAGASHAEAQEAAGVARFAELTEGTGIDAVLASCTRGWASGGLHLTRADEAEGVVFDVHGLLPVDLLQLGTALVDLASSTRRPATVRITTTEISAIMDLPLLALAARTGMTASASQVVAGVTRVRMATPEGDLGAVETDAWAPRALSGDAASAATIVSTSGAGARSVIGEVRMRTGQELAAVRRAAAHDGVLVWEDRWRQILGVAAEYKQGG